MKIVTANGKRQLVISRTEWKAIGKKAGWAKEADIYQIDPQKKLVAVIGGVSPELVAQALLAIDPDITRKLEPELELSKLRDSALRGRLEFTDTPKGRKIRDVLNIEAGLKEDLLSAQQDSRVEMAVEKADLAFWASIAQSFPRITRGDLPADEVHRLYLSEKKAVEAWLMFNAPERT